MVLGSTLRPGEQPGPFVITQIADVADAAVAEQFGGQQGQERLQRRDQLRAGQAGLARRRWARSRSSSCGRNRNRPATLVGNSPSVVEGQCLDVGDGGDDRTVVGALARLPHGRQRCRVVARPARCNTRKR